MSRLEWGTSGQRFYEAGVDRGVLFINNLGIPWNGLKSVSENPTGGSPRPFYIDGIKYLNVAESEEFSATIEAFTAPPEFKQCDGELLMYPGLTLAQQPRKSFGLSYRTRIGNDVLHIDFAYKIHLVYNALASPSQRSRNSLGNSTEPLTLSWGITTTPPIVPGYKPTAHLTIDSRTTPPEVLITLEDILYGTDETVARLPSISEVMSIFAMANGDTLTVVDFGDGTFSMSGIEVTESSGEFTVVSSNISDNGDGTFTTT